MLDRLANRTTIFMEITIRGLEGLETPDFNCKLFVSKNLSAQSRVRLAPNAYMLIYRLIGERIIIKKRQIEGDLRDRCRIKRSYRNVSRVNFPLKYCESITLVRVDAQLSSFRQGKHFFEPLLFFPILISTLFSDALTLIKWASLKLRILTKSWISVKKKGEKGRCG